MHLDSSDFCITIYSSIKQKNMNTGKVLLGVLAGVAVGATLGILFAPDKGSNTRRKITEKGEDYVEELETKFNDMVAGFSKQFQNAKREASNFVENGKVKAEDALAELTAKAK